MTSSTLYSMFFDYLTFEKKLSKNTLQAYSIDMDSFFNYFSCNDDRIINASTDEINNFKAALVAEGKAVSSISRALSSVRSFYTYLNKNSVCSCNPAKSVKNDKEKEKFFEVLSSEEIDRLINKPSSHDEKGIRDRAMLEILYATGMKVSELISLNIEDFNETLSCIRCHGEDGIKNERVIPLYPKAKKLLTSYISSSRKLLVSSNDERALFVNIIGERMTRQGFWKILKSYASAAGISKDITPRSLRHSFATHLLENGAGVDELQEILGHSDISTTQIYVKYMKSKSKNALLRFHPHA